MTLSNPIGLALLGLALPVIALHILRPRRVPVTVSSVFLWRSIERPVSSAKPWQRLRWSVLLLAQLLAVVLLALAVSQPVRLEASALADHTVFIVDASGSMAAVDGSPDRLADALDEVRALRSEMPDGGVASVVVAGARPRVVLTASGDPAELDRALRTVEVTPGRADFDGAFSLAESLDTGTTPIGFVFVSDGGITDAEESLLPPGTRYVRVGSEDTNRAITRLTVEPRGSGLHARATVRNAGGGDATQTLRVDVDGVAAGSSSVSIPSGQSVDVELDIPAGDLVEAYLTGGDDLLSADDRAVAVAGRRPDLEVLVVGDALFWEQLLASIPGVSVDIEESGSHDGSRPDGSSYDLVVYSGVAVPAEPRAPFLAVAPPNGVPGAVEVIGTSDRPAVTLVRTDDPLLTGLDLSEVDIATAQRVEAPTAEVLAAGESTPLLLRGEVAGHAFAYLSFGLRDSDLAVQVAFPVLGDRLTTELAGAALSAVSIEVGTGLTIDNSVTSVVTGPDGQSRTVEPGDAAPVATRPGFWTIAVDGRPDVVVAVNVPAAESAIRPVTEINAPPAVENEVGGSAQLETSLLPWVLVPLLLLLLVEFLLAWRRVGVTKRQWWSAVALRAVVAALVVGALLGPVVRRSSDRVATVFLVDASASLGADGRAQVSAFVRDALDGRPDSDLSAVVVFGAQARLDRVMQASSAFGDATVVVDRTATDIASALRLGAAVLPSDAKKRIVLVSDGRATSGDTDAELEALAETGIPVDVHTVGSSTGADAAVSGVDVPRLAREGDAVPVVVRVEATRAGSATVTLRRDDTEVGMQQVELVAGTNEVTFTDTVDQDAGAIMRYTASVTTSGDTLPENDVAFAAVPVDGPARVLLVEGSTGEATTISAALEAGGVGTETVGVGNIPSVQELSTYAGVVLVDVDARTLSGEQIADLSTAVRDLGRGMVTIGGVRSYGVGGYRDSPLSDLLPVDSEILDPKRRKTVAEVLSVDTSGSMAACHCRNENAPAVEGGIVKTDIARAAAARTIEALAATDQIGVLAWNSGSEWVIPLQQLPSADVVDRGLRSLKPDGATDLSHSLDEAAEALLDSNAELKHIILFTDGFTAQEVIADVADQAGDLYEEHGITTSVLGTGEGAAPALEAIAVAGNGRYYPGTDLEQVPQIMAEEAVIASRDFVNEGEFLPEVTSNDPVVRDLTSSPPLLGYVATTAKGPASTLLRIGPDRDPLLATWQAGLGTVSSWTSDTTKWSAAWSGWDGYVDFWSRLVKDTFPAGDDAGAVQAAVRGGRIAIDVEGSTAFPDGATAVARVAGPDGQVLEVPLERTGDDSFAADAAADRSGTWAVGVQVRDADGQVVLASSALANESYPAEFTPGAPDTALMQRISAATSGRGEVLAADVFDPAGLASGRIRTDLTIPFLVLAALLWPLAVLLSRLSIRGATVAGAVSGVRRTGVGLLARLPRFGSDPVNAPAPRPPARPTGPPSAPPSAAQPTTPPVGSRVPDNSPPSSPPVAAPPAAAPPAPGPAGSTMEELLARKRQRRGET